MRKFAVTFVIAIRHTRNNRVIIQNMLSVGYFTFALRVVQRRMRKRDGRNENTESCININHDMGGGKNLWQLMPLSAQHLGMNW